MYSDSIKVYFSIFRKIPVYSGVFWYIPIVECIPVFLVTAVPETTTCLGKSYLIHFPRASFVKVYQFVCMLLCLWF